MKTRNFRRHGSCHCGNIAFTLDWPEEGPLPLRQCSCSFCAKHSPVYFGRPNASLSVTVRDPSALSKYEFGTRTAQFHCCARCGVFVFATSVIADRVYAVLNAKTLDGAVPFTIKPVDFDGEAVDDRLARRGASWIPDVKIDPPVAAS